MSLVWRWQKIEKCSTTKQWRKRGKLNWTLPSSPCSWDQLHLSHVKCSSWSSFQWIDESQIYHLSLPDFQPFHHMIKIQGCQIFHHPHKGNGECKFLVERQRCLIGLRCILLFVMNDEVWTWMRSQESGSEKFTLVYPISIMNSFQKSPRLSCWLRGLCHMGSGWIVRLWKASSDCRIQKGFRWLWLFQLQQGEG